jgi:hypothetical protein
MTRPRQPDPSPQPGTRPPEYVIELWVSPQLQDRIHRPTTRAGQRPLNPQREARKEQPQGERIPGPRDRPVQPPARRQAEPELEAG